MMLSQKNYFYDEVIVLEVFTKNIERARKELLEDTEKLMEKSEITKKLQDDLALVVQKRCW